MDPARPTGSGYQSRTLKSLGRLSVWSGVWVAATALMAFGPRLLWSKSSPLTALAIGLNFCVGVGLLVAHKNYITSLDELQQKVYFNALAITVGVALIAGIPFSVMDMYDVIPFQVDIAHLIILMSVTFMAVFAYGSVRYR